MTPQQKWTAFQTIMIKEVLRFSRIWIQTILPPVITTGLYYIIFGKLIGEAIGTMGGTSYINFIVPGLIMMAVINNAYSNVVASFFNAKFHGNIQELLISPVPGSIVLLGYLSGGILRGLIIGLLVTLLSLFFTELPVQHIGISIAIIFLTAFLFSLAGFINAVYAKSFDGMNIIPVFVLVPLTYLGGVFYSIDKLPAFWQTVSQFNPILYMVNGFRYGFMGVSDTPIVFSFVLLIILCIILFAFSLHLLKTGRGIRD